MKDSGPINSTVINRGKFAFFITIFLIGSSFISLFLSVQLGSPFIGFIIIVALFCAPWVFEKRIRKPFSKTAEFHFFDNYFTITLSNINNGAIENTETIKYADIAEFLTGHDAKNGFYSLRLYLKDGRYIRYIFCDTKYNNIPQVQYGDIAEIFFQYAKLYNITHTANAITIHPYFATTISRIVLTIISACIVAVITTIAILKPNILFPSLIPVFFFYFIVLGARLSYKSQMKRLTQV